jgi:hypothetical protein
MDVTMRECGSLEDSRNENHEFAGIHRHDFAGQKHDQLREVWHSEFSPSILTDTAATLD